MEKVPVWSTRPSDITRERILKAAERLFADRGYEETSIRAIVAKARVNQAAINYHFGGKDGLYREVLLAVDLVRRFLPKADQSILIMAAVWLVGQCSIFVLR